MQVGGALQAVEVKLTATPTNRHTEGIDKLVGAAAGDVHPAGVVVRDIAEERVLAGGHLALPWQRYPAWLRARLEE